MPDHCGERFDKPQDKPQNDLSPGDVIYAYEDGTIVLDDGITTYNRVKADQWLKEQKCLES